MKRIAAILLAALAAACSPSPPSPERVDAARHDSFWLWAGVKPQPVLKPAKRIYILQSEVRDGNPPVLLAQRPAIPRVKGPEVWMVVRVGTIRWTPGIYDQVEAQLLRWQQAGNRLAGLQIDFDAKTRHLEDYAAFLRDLRRRLPPGFKLSVTGLLDWSANGDPTGLAALAGTVDEVVLQVYQGRKTIPGYRAWLTRLDALPMPFRIGLVQGGEWSPPPGLEANPRFKGYVVFLLNDAA